MPPSITALVRIKEQVPEQPSTKQFAAIVFDLDGVLILSRDCHRQAFEEVFADFGIFDFHYSEFAGWRTPEVFREMFARHGVANAPVEACSARKTGRARQLIDADFPLSPDCVATVRRLQRDGYRLALASSGSRTSVQAFLDHTELQTAFESVLSGNDVARAKPDPELFARSIANLGLAPEACLVVEDAVAGVQAAQAAGAAAVGIAAQPASEEGAWLLEAGAIHVLPEVRELPGFLQQLGARR